MQRLGRLARALLALGLASHGTSGWSQQSWWSNWFKVPGAPAEVAPAPGVRWEPRQPLPPVSAPAITPTPQRAAPLTLAELTEYALRNNPPARQAWHAARAAAAGIGIE